LIITESAAAQRFLAILHNWVTVAFGNALTTARDGQTAGDARGLQEQPQTRDK
jgi:hypothetical protein